VPTRRMFELMIVTVIAMKPIGGLVKLWAHKSLMTAPADSTKRSVAEVGVVIA
jgi:hypothetical protein